MCMGSWWAGPCTVNEWVHRDVPDVIMFARMPHGIGAGQAPDRPQLIQSFVSMYGECLKHLWRVVKLVFIRVLTYLN